MGDTMREAFEAFHGRRQGKGAAYREALFRRRDDDTYLNESVQRHWWTWQNAVEAGRQQGMEQARREPLTDAQIDAAMAPLYMNRVAQRMGRSDDVRAVRAIEAAHGITPTQEAGDSDTGDSNG